MEGGDSQCNHSLGASLSYLVRWALVIVSTASLLIVFRKMVQGTVG